MRVTVRLFARLRDLVGAGELTRECAEGDDVRAVWAALAAEHPELAPYAGSVSCAVNAEYSRMSARLAEGDEVAFLPPVSGGSAETRVRAAGACAPPPAGR
jgi:molybdopterin converting factor subunit 1